MKTRKSERGASLVDALMGTALFIGTAAVFTANTITVVKVGAASGRTSAATAIAGDFVERVRAMQPWEIEAMEDGEESGLDTLGLASADGGFVRRWSIQTDQPRPGLAQVRVSVSWRDAPGNRVSTVAYVCTTPSCS